MDIGRLYETIPQGAGNGIRLRELCFLWDMRPGRARRVMALMNRLLMPVCNVGRGYYRPLSREDLKPYIRFMRSYKRAFEKKVSRLSKVYGNWNQLKMRFK